MAVKMTLIPIDAYFHSIPEQSKILINDLALDSQHDFEMIEETVKTVYMDKTISLTPQCSCGNTKGLQYKGTTCNICGGIVTDTFHNNDPIIWFKRLEGTPKFINPHWYLMFKHTTASNFNILKWIYNTSYNASVPSAEYMKHIISGIEGFERSYEWLVNNLEVILITLINSKEIKQKKKDVKLKVLLEMLRQNPETVFSEYLPLLNKRMFYVETNTKGKYTFSGIADAYDVISTFIVNSKKDITKQLRLMGNTVDIISQLDETTIDKYLAGKPGIFRKHIYGTRIHFGARAVITSLSGQHQMDEVHLPWSLSVTLFRPHIMNYFIKMGLTHTQAIQKWFKAVQSFDQDISNIFDDMLKSVKGNRIPLGIMRNPSLHRGSVMLLYASVIKRDPADMTMGTSVLIAKLPNKDYDGDSLNIMAILDERLHRLMEKLSIFYSVPDLSSPSGISGLFSLTDPGVLTLSSKINRERNEER